METKRLLKKSIVLLLIFTMVSSLITVPKSVAANDVTITISGTKDYDKAKEVLDYTNQIRQENSVPNLELDENLSNYAMKRAAEIAINFSHTRPDGRVTLSCSDEVGMYLSNENIAAGNLTATGTVDKWMEDDHKLPILSANNKSIGIGCYQYSGMTWWVQVFSSDEAKQPSTTTGTENSTDNITVSPDSCPINLDIEGFDNVTINPNETIKPTVYMYNNGWQLVDGSYMKVRIDPSNVTWKSLNTNIFTVNSNGTVTGVAEGTSTLTASLGNHFTGYTITVNPEEGISLNKSTSTLFVGDTDSLKVTYIPEGSDQGTINWVSDNEGVATVDENGKITAVSKGTATITATASKSGKQATCTVTVKQPYTGMELNTNSITLDKSKTAQIEVTKTPEVADEDAEISFVSSDPDVATVSDDGTVTGVSAGNTTITVTMTTSETNQTFTDTCDVNVIAHIESINIENGDFELYKGQTQVLNVTFNPDEFVEGRALEWSSSDEDVAVIEQDNQGNTIVKAIAPGTTTITATTVNGISDDITLTVPEIKATTVVINKTNTTIEKGESEKLTATVLPENTTDDTTITWKSEFQDIATVDQEGNVLAVSPGSTTITATTASGISAECEVKVTCALQSISLNYESENLVVNGDKNTVQLLVSKNPIDADAAEVDVVWSSGNEAVATVSDNGLVTAVAPGTAVITATLEGKDATCTIKVDSELKSVEIENQDTTLELTKNQTAQLNTIYNPENATLIPTASWTTDDESVATVDENGKVTAVGVGTTTIRVDYGNGITASREVEVSEILADSITISNIVDSLLVAGQIKLEVELNPVESTDELTWTSSDSTVLSVDNEGNVTAHKAGTATITVTTENGKTASVEIEVKEKNIESIEVTAKKDTLTEGEKIPLEVKANPFDYTDSVENVTYQVSNPSILSVDENGMVTALKAGEAVVTVSLDAKQADGTVNTLVSQIKLNVTEATQEDEDKEDSNKNETTEGNINNNETTDNSQKNAENESKETVKENNELTEGLTTSPHTGDMNIVALVAMMVISLLGMIVIIKKK